MILYYLGEYVEWRMGIEKLENCNIDITMIYFMRKYKNCDEVVFRKGESVFSYICLLFFIVLLPIITGNLVYDFIKQKESCLHSWIYRWVYGWCTLFALFELSAVPLIMFKRALSELCIVYLLVIAAFVLVLEIVKICNHDHKQKKQRSVKKEWTVCERLVVLCALGIILFQVFFVVWKTHMDADDTFYIGHAVTSLGTNSMYQFSPYTGEKMASIPINYVLSPLPIFWAFLSKMSEVHPAVIAHIFVPMIFIPTAYSVVYLIGCRLFKNSRSEVGCFMLIYAVLQQFGYTSVYTASTFLLFRIWQGKAMIANIFLPLVFLSADTFYTEKNNKKYWIVLGAVSLATCFCSSMGIVLGGIEMVAIILAHFLVTRKLSVLKSGIIACVPYILGGIMYLIMKF